MAIEVFDGSIIPSNTVALLHEPLTDKESWTYSCDIVKW